MGISNWEIHEKECYQYLKNVFGQDAEFIHHGGSDSTISDIQVRTKNGQSFWIECKSPQAQSGQFVAIPKDGRFYFSERNKSVPNEISEFIINIMNRDFYKYSNAGTAGIGLDINSDIFAYWIKNMYKKKGVKYFITHSTTGKYVILPLDDISRYYSIGATFRAKKSGSSNVAKSSQEMVAQRIVESLNVSASQIEYGVKMRVDSPLIADKQKIEINGYVYMFSKTPDGCFVIRRLSNTNNLNVIFSVSLKNESGLSEDSFRSILKG
ncbi:MAG: hypothetical protein E7077_09590 [Bacteroidales bacterium]|jgi:hypothetical protein|nr:hypothetical protein [Bacteroidales bacterium]